MMNTKKFYLQLSVSPERTLFDIVYYRKNNDVVAYNISYDKERKIILNMKKKINSVVDPSDAFNIVSFFNLDAAEKNLKEKFSRILMDIKEHGKIRENQ